jgi:methionine aminopeptidase
MTVPLSISLEGRIKGGEVELKDDQATIRTLFEELSMGYPGENVMSIAPEINQGEPFEYLVMVNNGAWKYLSECQEEKLKKGDKVTITMGLRMAGGG